MKPFPHHSDATHKIRSRLDYWPQRYSSWKVWTEDDDRQTANHWAFGSGELKKNYFPHLPIWGWNRKQYYLLGLLVSSILANWPNPFFTKGVSGVFFHFILFSKEIPKCKDVDPDQTPHSVSPDLDLHSLPRSPLKDVRHDKPTQCAPSEDSDHPGHSPSLIRVFAVRMKKHWVLSYPLSMQKRLWSDWADVQADLSLRWAHTHFVGFVMSQFKWVQVSRSPDFPWLMSLWLVCSSGISLLLT